jgi:transposase
LVLARVAHQGSRLSAVRWARDHAVKAVLGLDGFDEEDLYTALNWAAEHQEAIEQRLYRDYVKRSGQTPALVLYDVTSSYFEGEHNELGEYGYNRDGKKGKKQIVIGLLTARDGEPLSVEVFQGNTVDPATLGPQIDKLAARFQVQEGVVPASVRDPLTLS